MTRARTGRSVTSRVRARGWLRTESPLYIGGLGGDPAEPLPIAVDGLGRVYVPGTSLAGVLRSWSRGAESDAGVLADLWGYIPEGDVEGGRASRVIVADALVAAKPRVDGDGLPADLIDRSDLEFRPSAGIDRVTGAAAQEFLYGRAVVPAGCYLRLEIDAESHADTADDAGLDEARMGVLLEALIRGDIRVGAATTRGLGAVRLLEEPLDVVVDRFDSPEGLLAILRNDPARRRSIASLRSRDPELPSRRDVLDVCVRWKPLAPIMVRGTSSGLIVDTLPLTTRVHRGQLTLVLPGASLKGALRGHAEFIERTARGPAAAAPSPVADSVAEHSAVFRAQLDQLRAVRALFGSAPVRRHHVAESHGDLRDVGPSEGPVRDDAESPPGSRDGGEGTAASGPGSRKEDRVDPRGAGALRVEECTAEVTIPEALWWTVTASDRFPPGEDQRGDGVRERAEPGVPGMENGEADAGPPQPDPQGGGWNVTLDADGHPSLSEPLLDRLEDLGVAQADHVALDRWTGGAATGRLFHVLEPHAVEWEPIRLSVDLTRLKDNSDHALALLLLTLRDMAAGRIPLGALVNRGFGDIEVTGVTLTGGSWPDGASLSEVLTGPQSARIAAAWTTYLAQEAS